MISRIRPTGLCALALFMLVAVPLFQNCSPGFEVIKFDVPSVAGMPVGAKLATYTIPTEPFEHVSQIGLGTLVDQESYDNFWEFAPKHALYSYGADKRRWTFLPAQTQIDNSNPDGWKFPQGTVLMKLFSLNGRKVETRVFEKISDGNGIAAWRPSVYLWRADQSEADLLKTNDFYSLSDLEKNVYEAGLVADRYRIVAPNQCVKCHSSSADAPLGFNYLQLSQAGVERNVLALSRSRLLSNEVTAFDSIPGSALQQAAIGYMQTNCAVCHNGGGPGPHDFKHRSTAMTVADEAVIQSAIKSPGLISPGDPMKSRVYIRFSGGTMPPATIDRDLTGQQAMWDWISTTSF